MADLKLDASGDLAIENGDLVIIDGVDAVAQDIQVRLKFFLGEWYLDTRLGMPYYGKILGEKPRLNLLKNIFRKAILTTPGMINIDDFQIDYEGAERKLIVSFTGHSTSGTFTFNREFIL